MQQQQEHYCWILIWLSLAGSIHSNSLSRLSSQQVYVNVTEYPSTASVVINDGQYVNNKTVIQQNQTVPEAIFSKLPENIHIPDEFRIKTAPVVVHSWTPIKKIDTDNLSIFHYLMRALLKYVTP